jgi:hypothetical protein
LVEKPSYFPKLLFFLLVISIFDIQVMMAPYEVKMATFSLSPVYAVVLPRSNIVIAGQTSTGQECRESFPRVVRTGPLSPTWFGLR